MITSEVENYPGFPSIPGFDLIGRFVLPPVEWAEGHYFALARLFAGL